MLANHVFWRLMLFLLLLLQPSVLWLSTVSFNNDAKAPPKWILREFDVSRIGPQLGWLPHLEHLHGKIWPRLRELLGLADQATRLGWSPHLSCKRDQITIRDHMDRQATSPTWSPHFHVNRPWVKKENRTIALCRSLQRCQRSMRTLCTINFITLSVATCHKTSLDF